MFALPAVYPAVSRGGAVIRTAHMSTHEDRNIDFVLEVVAKLVRKHGIVREGLEPRKSANEAESLATAVC